MRPTLGALLTLAALLGSAPESRPSARGPVLVELFTSQGCSSCPAADALVGRLEALGYGPDQVVPLTYHVTYWDDLGWEDPFGQDAFNLRQMAYARTFAEARTPDENTIRGPYTPQMVVDGGVHFSGAMETIALKRIEEARARSAPVFLEARARTGGSPGALTVQVVATAAPGQKFDTDRAKIGIFAALHQKRVTTPVSSGENAKKILEEFFVVRQLAGPKLFRGDRSVTETSFELHVPSGVALSECGVAVFVQAMDSLHVLAATNAEIEGSPGSTDLLFTSGREGNAEIFVRRAGSAESTNLTRHPSTDNWPVWSPDGTRIAFQSKRADEKLDVWVMNADGSEPKRLTDHPDHDYLPSWSPDGRRIAFASWRSEAGGEERAVHLYVMNADGTDPRRLIAESIGTSGALAWSPDGSTVAFTKKTGERADLFLAAPDGTGVRRLTDDDAYDGSPAFSPDGAKIAFYSEDGTGSDLVVINVDGTGRRVLVGGGQAWYPRWSPDGRWIVFTAPAVEGDEKDLDLFAVPVDGSRAPFRIVEGPARDSEGSWRPR